ncbi:MAG: hypothetical protein HOG49_38750 [Candidatus Scalindua sp.]|nr:hypothetical protein [Candidatus Scalindua sp.]
MINKLTVINDLHEIVEDDYNRVINDYIDAVTSNPAVNAIYKMGNISDPGISDLDLIVVVKDCRDSKNIHKLSINNSVKSDLFNKVFLHDIFLCDTSVIREIRYTSLCDNLELLFGDEQKIMDVGEKELGPLSLQIIFDFISSRLVQFKQYLSAGSIGIRGTLVRVSSIRHSYNLLKNLGVHDKETESFISQVIEMRKNSRSVNDDDIIDLFLRSFNMFERIVQLAADFFFDKYLNFFTTVDPSNSLKLNNMYNLKFLAIPLGDGANADGSVSVYYPEAVFYHYLEYTRGNHPIANIASNYLSITGGESFDLSEEYKNTLEKRLSFISKQLTFLKRNRVNFAMCGYPGFIINQECLQE